VTEDDVCLVCVYVYVRVCMVRKNRRLTDQCVVFITLDFYACMCVCVCVCARARMRACVRTLCVHTLFLLTFLGSGSLPFGRAFALEVTCERSTGRLEGLMTVPECLCVCARGVLRAHTRTHTHTLYI
jgi:hypothetical protein